MAAPAVHRPPAQTAGAKHGLACWRGAQTPPGAETAGEWAAQPGMLEGLSIPTWGCNSRAKGCSALPERLCWHSSCRQAARAPGSFHPRTASVRAACSLTASCGLYNMPAASMHELQLPRTGADEGCRPLLAAVSEHCPWQHEQCAASHCAISAACSSRAPLSDTPLAARPEQHVTTVHQSTATVEPPHNASHPHAAPAVPQTAPPCTTSTSSPPHPR